jgi:hypothetical protein
MELRIKLTQEEVREIITAHVLKEVPVHTAGRKVYAMEKYGTWEVYIIDKETEDEHLPED